MIDKYTLVSNISSNTPTNLLDVVKDFDNLRQFSKVVNSLNDEEIEQVNLKFYTFLNNVRQLAKQYDFNEKDAVAYYKLKIWLESMK